MKQVKIFDTTLRYGEQSPGCSMNLREKLEVAQCLERLRHFRQIHRFDVLLHAFLLILQIKNPSVS